MKLAHLSLALLLLSVSRQYLMKYLVLQVNDQPLQLIQFVCPKRKIISFGIEESVNPLNGKEGH